MLLTSITPKQYKYYTGGCKSAFFRYNNSVEGAISTRYLLGNYCTWRSREARRRKARRREAKGERREARRSAGSRDYSSTSSASRTSERGGRTGGRERISNRQNQSTAKLSYFTNL